MTLRFGLALMNDFPPDVVPASRIAMLREQVENARVSSIESIWVLQHYLGSLPTLQPLPLLAALSPYSGEMTLGTNMFILPLRHPVGAAEEFSTLDHLSGGRAVAGLGLGYRENEFAAFGVPLGERLGRFTESVEIMRALWSGERVSYHGKYFHLDDEKISLPPVRPGGPPVWMGAGGKPAAVERAARLGDAWIIPPHVTGDTLVELLGIYRKARRSQGLGEAAELVVRRDILLDQDADTAWRLGSAARGAVTGEYARYSRPDDSPVYDYLAGAQAAEQRAREAHIFTDPDTAIERLKELEAGGITTVVLRMQWYGLPQERVLNSLELFARRVLPAFRDRSKTA
ncbi:LLM class flavin-dependent oxidoreductase [Actinomadura sp. LOL_016]|uniref:LLM class flavin-dependent oxidoreductase n=1 Tax=unclassified Actinomadura TaxID=2626254 RepID=UPI003A7FA8F3